MGVAEEEVEEAAEGVVSSWDPKGETGSGCSWVQRQWLFVGPVFVSPVPVLGVDATVEISENRFDESLSSLCVTFISCINTNPQLLCHFSEVESAPCEVSKLIDP